MQHPNIEAGQAVNSPHEKISFEQAGILLNGRVLPDGSKISDHDYPTPSHITGFTEIRSLSSVAELVAQVLDIDTSEVTAELVMDWWNGDIGKSEQERMVEAKIKEIQRELGFS